MPDDRSGRRRTYLEHLLLCQRPEAATAELAAAEEPALGSLRPERDSAPKWCSRQALEAGGGRIKTRR